MGEVPNRQVGPGVVLKDVSVHELAPIFFIQCFVYPGVQGAISVNLDSVDIVEEEA